MENGVFCNYNDIDGLSCGRWVKDGKPGAKCKRHFGKQSKVKRIKGGHFSGDSKHRQDMGQFQAKEGR